MALTPGTRLGPYEVVDQIGVGGMGEVYKATDTNLKRSVAIKVLPASVAGDAERLARFQREAEVLAALNHPNIAAIYGLERSGATTALVMELVEGPTLADRIAQSAVPIDEALPIAKQIAEALEAAHEQGIIHRDLKPANIKVRPDGTVKVLDFGLAKAMEPVGAMSPGLSQSPTITTPAMTQAGMILGTAAYMSPEQARGRPADKRSDVWAFGCVLYEMLAGQRAFEGDDVADTLASVLKTDPDWTRLPADLPQPLQTLLKGCLERDPRQRVGDVSAALFVMRHQDKLGAPTSTPVRTRRSTLAIVGVASAILVLGLAAFFRPTGGAVVPPVVARFTIPLPQGDQYTNSGQRVIALSPDGRLLAYIANYRLYLRHLDQLDAVPIRGAEGPGGSGNSPRNPFFSPNGQWIGYWQSGQLRKVSVNGGAPVAICNVANPLGATWGADNTILLGEGADGVWRVSGDGGTPENVIKLKPGQLARSPQLLPDGRTILFSVAESANWDDTKIVVRSREGEATETIVSGGTDGLYLPTGHIAYVSNDTLLAVPFDVQSRKVTGGPVSLVEQVAGAGVSQGNPPSGVAHFAVSEQGALAYVPNVNVVQQRTLVWVDRQGREEALKAPPRAYQYPRISPDRTRMALDIRDQETDIWIWDFARETLTRLTFGAPRDILPIWTPDSRRIVFTSERSTRGMFWQPADGTGTAELLTEGTDNQIPYGFTPDGSRLVYRVDGAKTGSDFWVLTMAGRRREPLLQSPFNERNGELSPDGRWLAYTSNESGRYEVFVRPFPNVNGGRWQVSNGGGDRPLWSRSGDELFFLSAAGEVMGVRVTGGSMWQASSPTKLVEGRYYTLGPADRTYDVSPDGRRFMMIKSADNAQAPTAPMVVVENWTEELKRLVSTR